jgi:hypothetical protein
MACRTQPALTLAAKIPSLLKLSASQFVHLLSTVLTSRCRCVAVTYQPRDHLTPCGLFQELTHRDDIEANIRLQIICHQMYNAKPRTSPLAWLGPGKTD